MYKKVVALLIVMLILTPTVFAAKEPPPSTGVNRITEAMESYQSLTDAQKNQIYKIDAKIQGQLEKLFKKYAELGVITEDEAKKLATMFKQRSQSAKDQDVPIWLMPVRQRASAQ